jgi:anti-sigma B factor antagonist
MSISLERSGDQLEVDVRGQLVTKNRHELTQAVLSELERGARRVRIDFAETGYIDSSGLGMLVSLSKRLRERGGELRLANLNRDLKTLFELTGLDTLFRVDYDNNNDGDGGSGRAAPRRSRPSGPVAADAERSEDASSA